MHTKLSLPLILSEDFDDSINIAYEYFAENINSKDKRPILFDKQIFIDAYEFVEQKPVGFWHAIGLGENHHFKVLPCSNDPIMECCGENCNVATHQVSIKHDTELRNLCLFRASRLPWIIDIINMANANDPSIAIWLVPGGGRSTDKLHLRYNHYGNDYILIFSVERHHYRLISSFPVCYVNKRADYDRDYRKHKWSFFD